ncbi:hypothetical protein [Actinophytocola oryzae]|uniref:Uncharacterized protein n=1 Tax=Actinophytocola oryzae TaxID=502181 RepID=A0A4R7UVZ8_9PSEU|nr:hypothetical protein [Actinophytocola oryzae]TDV40112.1 hypothetical protein CLV71_124131 [Actinophytocola oryzae]
MPTNVDDLWLRGLFLRRIAHVPVWCTRPRVINGVLVVEAVCGRYVRVWSPETSDTLRCPDCGQLTRNVRAPIATIHQIGHHIGRTP